MTLPKRMCIYFPVHVDVFLFQMVAYWQQELHHQHCFSRTGKWMVKSCKIDINFGATCTPVNYHGNGKWTRIEDVFPI